MGSERAINNNAKGILLVEVILAVAILSILLSIIIQSMALNQRIAIYSNNYSKAIGLAENSLFQLFFNKETPVSVSKGRCSDPFGDFHYKLEREFSVCGEFSKKASRLMEATIEIGWASGLSQKTLEVITCVFDPD